MSKLTEYLWNCAELFSQFLNTVFLAGNPNMTVSARCYLNRHRAYWRTAYHTINKIFFWQSNHCYESWLSDLKFSQQTLEQLKGI